MLLRLFVLVLVLAPVMACPPESEFRMSLKKGLFGYLENPSDSTLSFGEVQDLIEAYLTVDFATADCSSITGSESGQAVSDILARVEHESMGAIPRCPDGTLYGECSVNKPFFCYSGVPKEMCMGPDMVPNSNDCGCPDGQYCQTEGTCY